MARILLDTTHFVEHLRGRRRIRPAGHEIHYSVITRAELFAGGCDDRVRRVLAPYREEAIDRGIAERAGRLRRETRITLPDALIAATALELQLIVVTRNVTDYEAVPRLRVRDEL